VTGNALRPLVNRDQIVALTCGNTTWEAAEMELRQYCAAHEEWPWETRALWADTQDDDG
jgi:hypothetical protein